MVRLLRWRGMRRANLNRTWLDLEIESRAQTRALNQNAASLVSVFGPDEGRKLIHGLLAVQEVARESGELPT